MFQKHFRMLGARVLSTSLLVPGVVARTNHIGISPAEGIMHVDVTYTEEANISDKTKTGNGAEEEDVSKFYFHATAAFEQQVLMQPAGASVSFYPKENARQKISGGVSYNGEIKRTALDGAHRPILDEKSNISFAGVLADDSGSSVPDNNAAGIQFGIQSDMTGGCQGKRTYYAYGNEKKIQTTELNSCGVADELHEAARVTRAPLNLDLRARPDGKETVRYAAQFQVTSCNLKPQYCVELKAAQAAANPGTNSEAMSDNWIGATTTRTIAGGFKIDLTLVKELKIDGTWKRHLQMTASVTPLVKTRAALQGRELRSLETADRLRTLV